MVAGAGAMLQASQEMARMRREMQRQMRERAARREAFRARVARMPQMDPVPKRAQFDCYQMCADCGFLTREAKGPCPACRQSNWMDLGHHETADTIRFDEEQHRHKIPPWVKVATGAAALVIFGIPIALAGAQLIALIALAVAIIGVPLTYVLTVRPLSVLLLRYTETRPYRWRLPIPLADSKLEPREKVAGAAEPSGETLTAPLSGKPCVAYQVSVLFDTAGDARPPEWALQEAAGVDFSVGDKQVRGDNVLVTKAVEGVQVSEDFDLDRFLRERGLFSTDGEFELFEARIEPGEKVEAAFYDGPAAVVVKSGD